MPLPASSPASTAPHFFRLWRITGWCLIPFLRVLLVRRLSKGLESATHLKERRGYASIARPNGPLLWLHAASVGESLSAFPLIDALLEQSPKITLLMTTTTLTGKQTLSRHPAFNKRLFHHFIPYDIPPWVTRFLDFWHPDGAVFIESELWPGIIDSCHHRGIAFMLVNARLSSRSARRWHTYPSLLNALLKNMAWITPRSTEDAQRFQKFDPAPLCFLGDMKEDAPPLPCNPEEAARLRQILGNRPLFVAASTHEGEEDIILDAILHAQKQRPDLLTIIVPRHPARGPLLARKFKAPSRSSGEIPQPHHHIWIADTLGELGLFYRLAERVFLGNSLCRPGGGHNPFEPLRLGCPTAIGPFTQNWRDSYQKLSTILSVVHDAASLSEWLTTAHPPPPSPKRQNHVCQTLATRILNTIPA